MVKWPFFMGNRMEQDRELQLTNLLEESNQLIQKLNLAIISQKKDVDFSRAVQQDESKYSMKEASKLLNEYIKEVTGLSIGRNKLFGYLRDLDILSSYESSWNEPYQRWVDSGHFVVKLTETNVGVKSVTLVTGKGLKYLQSKIEEYLGE